jgi:hypothetical protein
MTRQRAAGHFLEVEEVARNLPDLGPLVGRLPGAADSDFAAGSMSCARFITRITAVSTVSVDPSRGRDGSAIMIQAASALPMAHPPGAYLSIRHASA